MSMKDILNVIVVTPAPAGRFLEGIIDGTPKPGTLMTIKAGVEPVNGRHTWEAYNRGANGNRALIAVLREDELQGKGVEDAYVSGTRGFLYCPISGDEVLVRVSAPGTGTSDNYDIGQLFIAVDGTGLLIATTGSPESEPFQAGETISDVEAGGTLVMCYYTGH